MEKKPLISREAIEAASMGLGAGAKQIPGQKDRKIDIKRVVAMGSLMDGVNNNPQVFLAGAVVGAIVFGIVGAIVGGVLGGLLF